MTSIRVKFSPPATDGAEGFVYYQLSHERCIRHIATSLTLHSGEWDEKRCSPKIAGEAGRQAHLRNVRDCIRTDLERLARIVRTLESNRLSFTSDEVVAHYRDYTRDWTVKALSLRLIQDFRNNGRLRTAETYTAALKRFSAFLAARGYGDIHLDTVSPELIEAFEASLRARGNTPNTSSFYLRILRAIYRRATDAEVIEDRRPFRHVYTGVDKTTKRALPPDALSRIKSIAIPSDTRTALAADMFMMSFYLRGMSFIDMAFLRKSDLRNGYITYRRRKTGQRLLIKWTPEMQAIIRKYPENPTKYLLPIITRECTEERRIYRSMSYTINLHLKKVAGIIGLDIPLTMYCARHSWASVAQAKGIPVSVISEGMGHDSEMTTRIYLASIETAEVDKANDMIIQSI